MSKPAKIVEIADHKSYDWNAYYQEGAIRLKNIEHPHHIDVTVGADKGNGRRALNIDIFVEPGQHALKYVCHMVPYARKYEVFKDLPDKQLKWPGWDTIKQNYTEYKDFGVQYGKIQHRVSNFMSLKRGIVPHCAAGMYVDNQDRLLTHIMLFDKEYVLECTENNLSKNGKLFYVARGFLTQTINPDTLDIDV